ncbi:hypothetical protein B0H14DRAFT_2594257 [Mycena olivaceomarginata]|nr:hypothetical protein B0H14DRAFT_2594257 [Mycena olivaceomarginata]
MTQLAYTSSRLVRHLIHVALMIVDVDVPISFFQLEALLILLLGFKFILSSRIESPKKQSCCATAATRKTHMHPNWNCVWSLTSQGFALNAIKFRTTTYIKIDYSTRQARTRRWRKAGPLGLTHRRTGLHRRAALRLAHHIRLGSAFGAIMAARCALRMHVLHPFDPPRHKPSCASSAQHTLRRTTAARTRFGGGHGVRISTPDLGPATERRDMVVSNTGVGSAVGVELESVKKNGGAARQHSARSPAMLQALRAARPHRSRPSHSGRAMERAEAIGRCVAESASDGTAIVPLSALEAEAGDGFAAASHGF